MDAFTFVLGSKTRQTSGEIAHLFRTGRIAAELRHGKVQRNSLARPQSGMRRYGMGCLQRSAGNPTPSAEGVYAWNLRGKLMLPGTNEIDSQPSANTGRCPWNNSMLVRCEAPRYNDASGRVVADIFRCITRSLPLQVENIEA